MSNIVITLEDWLERIKLKQPSHVSFISIVGDFNKSKTRVRMLCEKHGEWEAAIYKLSTGESCRKCGKSSAAKKRMLSEEAMYEKCLKSKKDNIVFNGFIEQYKGRETLVSYTCKVHGECRSRTAIEFERTGGCETCNRQTTEQDHIEDIKNSLPKGYTFISLKGRYKGASVSRFIYKCEKHGVKESNLDNIKSGNLCRDCGYEFLSKVKTIDWEDAKHRLEKVSDGRYLIKGYNGEWKGNKTKIICECPTHGMWDTTVAGSLMVGVGCSKCAKERISKELSFPDKRHIDDFFNTGVFLDGTVFTKISGKYWEYTCPKCSNDEYVKAGVCSGKFKAMAGHLKSGKLSCRCSKVYKYTKEQWEYRITGIMDARGYRFLGWLDEKVFGNNACVNYDCHTHPNQHILVSNLISGKGCSACYGRDSKFGYINVVYDGEVAVALKFGITNNPKFRLYMQNRDNLLNMRQIYLFKFESYLSCRSAEAECKKYFDCKILSRKELKDGFTETTRLHNIDKVVEIFKSHGGVLVQD